nr:MAG TPA: Helix-turn-helix of insertion element transposase [Caudoviricetes sp.]
MTEPKKPTRARKAPAKPGATKASGVSAIGQKVTDAAKTGRRGFSDELKAAARALWEGDPNISMADVAAEVGVTVRAMRRWSQDENWSKRQADMSERAHAAADQYKNKLSELGPEITTEQQKQAESDAAEETAVQLRAQVLDRHRKEWNAPRKLSYDAVKAKNFDQMKMAKITAEALTLIQNGERKAWGIDSGGDGQTNVKVIIERE